MALTYEPNNEDEVDKMFAEAYKEGETGKYHVKFLKKDPYDKDRRIYVYCGFEFIFEAYQGTTNYKQCYMLQEELGQDTTRH